jgi:hypothetical protein
MASNRSLLRPGLVTATPEKYAHPGTDMGGGYEKPVLVLEVPGMRYAWRGNPRHSRIEEPTHLVTDTEWFLSLRNSAWAPRESTSTPPGGSTAENDSEGVPARVWDVVLGRFHRVFGMGIHAPRIPVTRSPGA